MRHLRRWTATGPWWVVALVSLLLTAVALGPVLLWERRPFSVLFPAVYGFVSFLWLTLHQRRQDARLTGWDPDRVFDVLTRARAGELPADPMDRERLRGVLERAAREDRGVSWVLPAALLALVALLLFGSGSPPGWRTPVLVAYYVALGAVAVRAGRRTRRRREEVVVRLRGVGDRTGG